MKITSIIATGILVVALASCQSDTPPKSKKLNLPKTKPITILKYSVDQKLPHSNNSFTEGLLIHEGLLYESTGSPDDIPNTESVYGVVDSITGQIDVHNKLDKKYFGEGITIFDSKIYQLTWKGNIGFVYNLDTFEQLNSFPYSKSKEGWGLCNDGEFLYKSDGTAKIWKLDPDTGKELGYIEATTNKTILKNINELEWVDGKIYANTYQFEKDVVVIIDPVSGAVEGVVDFSGLKEMVKQHPELNVLNGIAYHKERQTFFVTGKNWDKLFEVKIVPKS